MKPHYSFDSILLTFIPLCSGINRLTRNIELALPILDDAFR